MEVYAIPVDDKFILYRPLLQLAFLGNRSMAHLALSLARQPEAMARGEDTPARQFLDRIGFLAPDPPAPMLPDLQFRPTTTVLLMTNQCPLRCVYCYANAGVQTPQSLSFDQARTAIDTVCDNALALGQSHFGVQFHGGGEPIRAWGLLREVAAYARCKPLPANLSIVSSGVWSKSQRAWLLDHLDSVSLSMDGGPQTQNRQRPFSSGHGSFDIVMQTVKALDERQFPYGIRMTATAPWREQMAEDVRFICDNTACPTIQIEPAFNTVRGEPRWPTPDEAEAFVEGFMAAYEIAHQAGRTLYYSGARPWTLTASFCSAPYSALIVSTSGHLVTCYEVTDSSHPLAARSMIGRLQDGQVVVYDEVRHALFNRLAERRVLCRECMCYWHCAGDCYVRAYSVERGSQTVFGPRCDINRAILTQLLLWNIGAGGGVWNGQRMVAQG